MARGWGPTKASEAGIAPDPTSFRDPGGCSGVLGVGKGSGDKGGHGDVGWQAIPTAKEKGRPC